MNVRQLMTLLLAVSLLAPAAAAAPTVLQSDASTLEQTAEESGSGSEASGSATSNFTELYVDSDYRSLGLKPGQNETFTVTVENGEDSAVTVSPYVYVPTFGQDVVKSSWVTIEPANTTIEAGEDRQFNVTVSVPEGTELGYYSGTIAFTNETRTLYGDQERPVHDASFSVDVYKEPTVTITGGQYAHANVQTNESYTHTITIENDGDSPTPVEPKITFNDRARGEEETPKRSWITVDAPDEIGANETGTVNVTFAPPANATVGNYNFEVDLGLEDPAREEYSDYWQRVDMNFDVWEEPDEPYTTTIDVDEDTENVTVKLQTQGTSSGDSPSFDVSLVGENGGFIMAEQTQQTSTGYVDYASDAENQERFDDDQRTFTFKAEDVRSGEWTVQISSENAVQFSYEIIQHQS